MPGSKGLFARATTTVAALLLAGAASSFVVEAPAVARTGVAPNAVGGLDCNGFSTTQRSMKLTSVCTDPKGYEGGRFFDNGHYIGHDEPIVRFISNRSGSGNDVTWVERLPKDPSAAPTVATPGSDVTHWFELSIAPWFSMALCNPESYPYTPCTPKSDANAPVGNFPWATPELAGGGSAFLEMQFYPPGFGPFADSISCDNTHWCASLRINDLECDVTFEDCNPACVESTNFAFIQTDGVPVGPPSPQLSTIDSLTPTAEDAADEPGRPRASAHLRRRHRRRQTRLGNQYHRPDHGEEWVHGRVGRERVHGHEPRRLLGDAVELRARVRHLATAERRVVGRAPDERRDPVRDRSLRALHEDLEAVHVLVRRLLGHLLEPVLGPVRIDCPSGRGR